MTKKAYLLVSGAIFAAASLLHLARAIYGWAFELGSWSVPLWASWPACIGFAALALWAYRLNKS